MPAPAHVPKRPHTRCENFRRRERVAVLLREQNFFSDVTNGDLAPLAGYALPADGIVDDYPETTGGVPHRRNRSGNTESKVGPRRVTAYITSMSEIVNLRRARKQRARTEAEAKAAANRSKHGRTKAERELSRAEAESAAKRLDGHKREPDG